MKSMKSMLAFVLASSVATAAHATEPSRAIQGVELRVDTGPSARFAVSGEPSGPAWGFGASLAYGFANGISVDGRYGDLGVARRASVVSPLQTASVGVRYAFPYVVMPFGELRCGTAFDPTGAYFAGAIAIGLAVPIGKFLVGELSVRDWLVPDAVALRSITTFNVGLTVRFSNGT